MDGRTATSLFLNSVACSGTWTAVSVRLLCSKTKTASQAPHKVVDEYSPVLPAEDETEYHLKAQEKSLK